MNARQIIVMNEKIQHIWDRMKENRGQNAAHSI